jgi:2-dehydropantoate 2-reductase
MAFDRVVVVGAGAIGSLYAVKLSARCRVTVVARQAHVDAINHHGLRMIGLETATARIDATTTIDTLQPGTLVLITTKVNDNAAAAAALAPRLAADTVVVCIQNGLGGEDIVRQAIAGHAPAAVVLRAITQFGAIFCEPGLVDFKVSGHTLIEAHARSQEVADLLTASGLAGRVSDAIRVETWRKLIFNCVINPITSITGTEVGAIADPKLDPLKQLVVDECLAVARADGVAFEDADFVRAIGEIFGPSRNIASMRQDLMRGHPTEIEHMNGAVARLGARHGIDCPVNAALTAIIRAMEGKIAAR